jgi:predicted nucleic acid-binding Zn ribbon protein
VRRTGRTGSAAAREGFETVGTVLDEVLRGLRLETRFAAAEATERWSDVVGPEVIARTRCVGVRDGELLVEVQGATWMGHLAVLRQGILERMNETLAAEKRLRAIRFVPMRSKEEIKR